MLAALATAAAMAAGSSAVNVNVTAFPIVCGQARGVVTVAFPPAVRVPLDISPTAIRLNSTVPGRVVVSGRTVTIRLPLPKGIMCHSIVLAPLTIHFTGGAGLRVGTAKTAVVTHGAARYRARISS
jgi:hypothetical protein